MDERLEEPAEKMKLVRVGEHTRHIARAGIPRQIDKLKKELQALNLEKADVEMRLNDESAWKREQLADIYSKRYPKSEMCQRTNAIESELHSRRRPLLRELHAVEERRNQIRGQLQGFSQTNRKEQKSEQLCELQKIRLILGKIADKLGCDPNTPQ